MNLRRLLGLGPDDNNQQEENRAPANDAQQPADEMDTQQPAEIALSPEHMLVHAMQQGLEMVKNLLNPEPSSEMAQPSQQSVEQRLQQAQVSVDALLVLCNALHRRLEMADMQAHLQQLLASVAGGDNSNNNVTVLPLSALLGGLGAFSNRSPSASGASTPRADDQAPSSAPRSRRSS